MSSRVDEYTSWRAKWRSETKAAMQDDCWPLFRLRSISKSNTTFEAEYIWSRQQPYLAISHSWTDRTGPGNSITIHGLAPWPVCITPSKAKFFLFLWDLQVQTALREDVDVWFWLDLLCIDQSWEDLALFSRQLQQMPSIFSKADGTIVLIASKSCLEAQAAPSLPSGSVADHEWHTLRSWLKMHHDYCCCTPMMDAWITRVWTRQELLYSNSVWLVPVDTWAPQFNELHEAVWTSRPIFFRNVQAEDGLDEFASCLVTWAEKNHRSLSSVEVAGIALDLIRGREVALIVDNFRATATPSSTLEWFAFNWTMILNGSIRRTSKARDAIISQMLLLPGYQVPELTPTTTLQHVAYDASLQFRRLIPQYQLVPKTLGHQGEDSGQSSLAHLRHVTVAQPKLADVLEIIGSPTKLQQQVETHGLVGSNQEPLPNSSLVVYRSPRRPTLRLLATLDLVNFPHLAMQYFLDLKTFWSKLARCTIGTRVWSLLQSFHEQYKDTNPQAVDLTKVSQRLIQIACTMLHGWHVEHRLPSCAPVDQRTEGWDAATSLSDSDSSLPALHAVQISYASAEDSPHVNLLFGHIPESPDAEIFLLGLEKGIMREIGVFGSRNGSQVELHAFGIILA